MKQHGVGLVGLGKLGTAMMTHWNKNHIKIGIYHPSKAKVQDFVEQFPNSYSLTENELRYLDILLLALPAPNVIPFISQTYTKENPPSTKIINMATALDTKEIKSKFPSLNVLGVKYMGHARDLMEHGNGLFITEYTLPEQIEDLFQFLGEIKNDHESCLTEVNKLATYLAVQAAINIESEFAKKGYSPEYVNRALTSIAPEVIRGYCEGSLGHFAKEIVKEIKGEV
ncbi:6-phosphogluconate dehydrogenase-like protein [Bacillus oleivorans]|uniref:6-phosphogluconate dehydrogenase-like protein n=1 Tax=Bacillus oleivorans TaxID=1448271 RepID=A0A285CQU1_9BACI|nr:NAD(P)-binding domain-containing protein [Bacillus oleivorans]SNX69438.1 6-phosphogluconate dehydrogenase-like protein [Bacillus oleivorans]